MVKLTEVVRQTENDVNRLGEHIDKGHIANTKKLADYGEAVKALLVDKPPELSKLVDTLTLDTTINGPIYKGLTARLADVKADVKTMKGLAMIQSSLAELYAIQEACKMENFGWMLTDPINVLADMSEGKLARVEAMSKEAGLKANNAEDYGAGSQLVGNPSYGEWTQNSGGQSFWHWYGQYAFFSSMLRLPIYYGNWSRHRDYSYYHEAGRHQYTAPRQQKTQQNMEKKARQKFQKDGKSFTSPYDKRKTGSARATMQSKKVANSFTSSYSKSGSNTKSSRTLGSAGSRKSPSSTSRSFGGRGK